MLIICVIVILDWFVTNISNIIVNIQNIAIEDTKPTVSQIVASLVSWQIREQTLNKKQK